MKRNIVIVCILLVLIIVGIAVLGNKKNSDTVAGDSTVTTEAANQADEGEASGKDDSSETQSSEEIIDEYEIQLKEGEKSGGM